MLAKWLAPSIFAGVQDAMPAEAKHSFAEDDDGDDISYPPRSSSGSSWVVPQGDEGSGDEPGTFTVHEAIEPVIRAAQAMAQTRYPYPYARLVCGGFLGWTCVLPRFCRARRNSGLPRCGCLWNPMNARQAVLRSMTRKTCHSPCGISARLSPF